MLDAVKSDPLREFIANVGEAQHVARQISEYVDDHMGTHPDDVSWANVGDAARLLVMLRGIAETFGVPHLSHRPVITEIEES